MGSVWYYTRDGRNKSGPFSSVQLKELATSGQLQPTDMVWKEGMSKWMAVSEINELLASSSSGPIALSPVPASPPFVIRVTSSTPTAEDFVEIVEVLPPEDFVEIVEVLPPEDFVEIVEVLPPEDFVEIVEVVPAKPSSRKLPSSKDKGLGDCGEVAITPSVQEEQGDGTDSESALVNAVGFLVRINLFFFAPIFLVLSWHILGENLLLVILLLVNLLVFVGNPNELIKRFPWLGKIALVGDGLRVLERLQTFYEEHRPKSLMFYVCYPIACLVWLPFSAFVRTEARIYAGVIISIVVALLLSTASSYSDTFPPYLQFGDVIDIIVVKIGLALIAILCVLVPIITTNFKYQLSGKKWRMRLLAMIALLSTVATVGYILSEKSKTMGFMSAQLLHYRFKSSPEFRTDIKDSTAMFLLHAAVSRDYNVENKYAIHPELTKKYQSLIGKLAVGDEAKGFHVFTLPVEHNGKTTLWLGVWVNFSQGFTPHVIGLVCSSERAFYGSWDRLPDAVRAKFQVIGRKSQETRFTLGQIGQAELIDDWSDIDLQGPMFFPK